LFQNDLFLSGDETITYSSQVCSPGYYTYFGDCDDYSHLFISMARTAGINAECVSWQAGEEHAWNAALINDQWEYVDTNLGAVTLNIWSEMVSQTNPNSCKWSYNDYSKIDECGN